MGIIDIIEGSFPSQPVLIMKKELFSKTLVMMIKTYGGEKVVYNLRSALKSIETVIEHKVKPTIKIALNDNNIIICKADQKSIEEMKIALALGPEEGEQMITVISKKRDKHQATVSPSGQGWTAGAKRKERPSIPAILTIIIVIPAIFIAIGNSGTDSVQPTAAIPEAQSPEEIVRLQKLELEANREARVAKLLNDVKAYEFFLAPAEQDFKVNKPSNADLEKIRKTLSLFRSLAEALNNARLGKADLSANDTSYFKGIERRLSSLQQRTLPGLRLAFKKQAAQLLWEYDVYVSVSGSNNSNIEFASGMFASNANIKAAQEQLGDILTEMRFKQTRFKWYKGADEFTYYKLETPPDTQLAMFKFAQFQALTEGYKK